MTKLVLIGGGHSHAIALKLWQKNPLPNVNLTLISDTIHTPYSGMLPGHIAGFYSSADIHIDLVSLTKNAQVEFCLDKAIGLDLAEKTVICTNHPPISFDYLSIDIGSTPVTNSVPGAEEYAIPAKPVPKLLENWNKLLQNSSDSPKQSLNLVIVGGGAGGVELALNMQHRIELILPHEQLKIHLFHGGEELLPGHNEWVSKRLEKILKQREINLHLSERVTEVLPHQVIGASGIKIDCDYIFWVTQASAPTWIKESGLKTDEQGFILVNQNLQALSHPYIFAAGDIATMETYPRPKAGVFAVRQGNPLGENWQRIIQGKSLKTYIPQKRYLSLIGTGDKKAIASWGNLGWESPLLWCWKDYIDRKFMQDMARE